MKYFLGLEISTSNKGIYLYQQKYSLQLLTDTGYLNYKPLSTPMDHNIKLTDSDGDALEDISQHRIFIGRLMYLTISRLDIAFAVNKRSQFMSAPRSPHLQAVHHILQYIKSIPGQGILFSSKPSLVLSAYADVDRGSCITIAKSTTGFCIFIGESLITWKSKKQPIVSRSFADERFVK